MSSNSKKITMIKGVYLGTECHVTLEIDGQSLDFHLVHGEPCQLPAASPYMLNLRAQGLFDVQDSATDTANTET
ncbi:MAG: hypothetical protein HRU05_20210 [Oceanospirillaceae bacterium]|nr:hypothetical protein [Oceanospirillaceae bacterium]